ncbi:MAG: cysteine--tRNA ligase, partial [Gaiellaceae bacterium]|nr:cysteine--tRNA ligase [Gaiellaceae bacterium]
SEETLTAAAARAEGFREVFRNPSLAAAPDAWARFEQALDDDFATPVALALMHEWRDHELLRRALDVFGLGSLAAATDAPAELHELARRRQEARAARDFATADRLRAELESAGWDVRDDPGGYRLVPRP